jgi:hypothetical protein
MRIPPCESTIVEPPVLENPAMTSQQLVATATANELLPQFGLVYLDGEDGQSWAVTRSTPGPGLEAIKAGQRVKLTLGHHGEFSVVSSYEPLA